MVEIDRVRETDVERELVGGGGDFIADACHDEVLLEALGHARHHVVDERAVKSVQSAVILVVAVTLDEDVSVLQHHFDGGINLLSEGAEGGP